MRPSFARNLALLEVEGAGKTGCALHPRSRVQCAQRVRTRAYRSSGEHPAVPAQWLYGLCRDLLGDEFVFVTVIDEYGLLGSGRARRSSVALASLTDTGATG